MIDRMKWVDRKFDFGSPASLAPELLERLRGAPARLAERVEGLPEDLLKHRDNDKWSIQEHVGHLMDVEELFIGRLDEMDTAGFARVAHHARLNKPMRVCDMMLFEATHDDYHMVDITELFKKFG